jgi:hypothetical protein
MLPRHARVFAEFETNLPRERQLRGIAKAKAAGVYEGRPASIKAATVRELKPQGTGPVDIAKALKIGRASVYRVLGTGTDGAGRLDPEASFALTAASSSSFSDLALSAAVAHLEAAAKSPLAVTSSAVFCWLLSSHCAKA